MNTLDGGLDYDLILNDAKFQAALKRSMNSVQGFSNQAETQTSRVENSFSRLAVAAAGFFSVQAASRFVSQMVKVRGEFQQLSIAMTTMLDSKAKADDLMSQLINTAATTPFGLTEIAQGAKQLLAYGTAADDVNDTLTRLGNVASGLSIPLGDLVYLYGTTQVQGRLFTQDVRQFMGRGIPLVQELAKSMGKTTDQVNEMVAAGKIGFPEVQQVIKNMTDQGGMFYNLMEKQSKTLTGQISNLGDAFDQMLNDIGTQSEGVIGAAISGVASLVENYKTVLGILAEVAAMYGTYKAAIIAYNVVQIQANALTEIAAIKGTALTLVEKLQVFWIEAETAAQAALNKVMLANPYAAVAAVVVGLATAYFTLRDSATQAEKATAKMNEANETRKKQIEEQKQKTQELINIIKSDTSTKYAQLTAYKELQGIYPGVLKNMDLLAFKTKDLTNFQKSFNASMEKDTLTAKVKDYESLVAKVNEIQNALNSPMQKGAGVESTLNKNLAEFTALAQKAKAEVDGIKQSMFEANATDAEKLTYYNQQLSALKEQQAEMEHNLEVSKSTGNAFLDWKRTIESIALNKLTNQIADIMNKIKGVMPGVSKSNRELIDSDLSLSDLSETRKKIQTAYDSATDEAQRKQLASDLSYVDKRKKALDVYAASNAAANKKITASDQQYADKKRDILDQINKLNEDNYRKSLTQNDQEVQAVKDKYAAIFKLIEEYNKKAPIGQKIGSGTVTTLQESEQKEVGTTQYQQQTEALKTEIEKQKQIYQEYDAWKTDLGKESANAEFSEQKKGFDTYQDYIKGQIATLMAQTMNLGGMTPAMQQRLIVLQKMLAEAQQDWAKTDKNILAQTLKDTQSVQEKLQLIREKYQKKKKTLEENGQITPDRQKILDSNQQEEVNALVKDLLDKEKQISSIGDDIAGVTKDQIRAQIESLKNYLATATNLTSDQKKQLQNTIASLSEKMLTATNGNYSDTLNIEGVKQIQDLDTAISVAKKGIEETNSAISKLKINNVVMPGAETAVENLNTKIVGLNQNIKELQSQKLFALGTIIKSLGANVADIASGFEDIDKNISSALQTLSTFVAALGTATEGVASIKEGFAGLKAADSFAGLASSVASIGTGVGAVIGAVGSVVSLFTSAKESAKIAAQEQFDAQQKILSGEFDYNQLLAKRALMIKELNDGTLKSIQLKQRELELQLKVNAAGSEALDQSSKGLEQDITDLTNKIVKDGKEIIGDYTKLGKLGKTEYGKIISEIDKATDNAPKGNAFEKIQLNYNGKQQILDTADNLQDALKIYDILKKLHDEGLLDANTDKQFELLEKQVEAYNDALQQQQELTEAATEAFSGTTASAIADSIIDGFKQGKTSIEDFADDFESIIGNSILSTIKNSLLSGAVKKVWDDFQAFVAANTNPDQTVNPLTQSQIAQLRADWNKGITDTQTAIDTLQNALGIDLIGQTDQAANGLSASIKGITQDQADALTGLERGQYDVVKQQLASMKRSEASFNQALSIWAAIQVNTANTVTELKNAVTELKGINNNTQKSLVTARDTTPGF